MAGDSTLRPIINQIGITVILAKVWTIMQFVVLKTPSGISSSSGSADYH